MALMVMIGFGIWDWGLGKIEWNSGVVRDGILLVGGLLDVRDERAHLVRGRPDYLTNY
jgi:hypothetical protein